MNKCIKFIDLSGYSFSGKSAYNNLFMEFDRHHIHPFDFEFDIIRTKDGILDLYISLVKEWSPVRSSEAIRRFKRIIHSYSGNKTFLDRLVKQGRHYDFMFEGFTQKSHDYVDSLINSKWTGLWPYANENKSSVEIFFMKCIYYLGKKDIFKSDIYLSSPPEDEFIKKTKEYLNGLLFTNVDNDVSTIVTNNVFEPFNPILTMQFFENSRSIIIDRDPRDIYLSALNYLNTDGTKGWEATIGKNVDDFINRFKIYRANVKNSNAKNILRVTFEDLVINYDNTLKLLFDFLGYEQSIHKYKKKYFNPDVSKKSIAMWKNIDKALSEDIEKITYNLKENCLEL